ncbi:MAG: chitobiase/beta-hexosaminidase C-terminal domain-containing protein, partial [Chitinophagaceae bacterium]|nr:chitobiase/beta-hexosaminidase C-terminal domain-containing protein [Chitinophagaceae bacterium]
MFAKLHDGKKSCSLLPRTFRTIFTFVLIAFPFAVGFGQAVSFSTTRGFFDAPFQLSLTAGASETIRYTTDGSEPSATNGNIYSAPLNITTTAVIRAISVSATGVSPVVTHSYFFPADIIRQPATIPGWPNNNYEIVGGLTGNVKQHDYAMDPAIVDDPAYSANIINGLKEIPTLSVVMNQADFWTMNDGGEAEYPASVEVIYPNNPAANEHFNCGVEGHSHIRLKRSIRLVISNTYFPNGLVSNIFRNAPLNGNFAKTNFVRGKIILRAGNDRSWASPVYPNTTVYTRDEWYRQSQIDISGVGSPGTFMHLYINGIYWGLYNPVQSPDAGYSAQYFGGTYADWLSVEPDGIRSGDPARFNYLVGALTDKDMRVPANYNELKQYLDVSNFSDYLLLTWYIGMSDWPTNNFQGANRNNPVTPHQYYGWDAEFSWDEDSYGYDVNNGAWVHPDFRSDQSASSDMTKIWHSARDNSDFMMQFADRVYKHCFNNGKLTDNASRQRWQTLNNFISNAIIAESAKWGDAIDDGITRTKNDHWLPEVNRVDGLMVGNVDRFIAALRQEGYYPSVDAPIFNREGGITPAGSTLTITNPGGPGTIYYTTDGSDPRVSGGNVSPIAILYTGVPIALSGNITIKSRILNGTTWSAIQEASFFVPTLKINEFLATNTNTIQDEFGVYEDWIEIYNSGTQPVNIGGMYITDNLSNPTLFRIPDNNP